MISTLLLVLLPSLQVVVGVHNKILTEENFKSVLENGEYTFVKFFAPWCPHCVNIQHDWDRLADHIHDDKNVAGPRITVGEVDCTRESSVCTGEGVGGYPTITLYRHGRVEHNYQYNRDFDRMKRFLYEKVLGEITPDINEFGIYKLNSYTWKNFMSQQNYVPTIVKFYTPWCSHCQDLEPVFEELAFTFMSSPDVITFAEVNCMDDSSLDLCAKENIDAFPKLHMYKDGDLEDIFTEDRDIDHLTNFIWETVDPSRVVEIQDTSFMDFDIFEQLGSIMGAQNETEDEDYELDGDEGVEEEEDNEYEDDEGEDEEGDDEGEDEEGDDEGEDEEGDDEDENEEGDDEDEEEEVDDYDDIVAAEDILSPEGLEALKKELEKNENLKKANENSEDIKEKVSEKSNEKVDKDEL